MRHLQGLRGRGKVLCFSTHSWKLFDTLSINYKYNNSLLAGEHAHCKRSIRDTLMSGLHLASSQEEQARSV